MKYIDTVIAIAIAHSALYHIDVVAVVTHYTHWRSRSNALWFEILSNDKLDISQGTANAIQYFEKFCKWLRCGWYIQWFECNTLSLIWDSSQMRWFQSIETKTNTRWNCLLWFRYRFCAQIIAINYRWFVANYFWNFYFYFDFFVCFSELICCFCIVLRNK